MTSLSRQTCVLTASAENTFPADYVPIVYGGHGVTIMVADVVYGLGTAGGTEHDRLRPFNYSRSDVFIICFNVGMPISFTSVKTKWFPEACHYCPGVPCVVAAMQIDLWVPCSTLWIRRRYRGRGDR
ncbi:hypothetical protein B0H12DRAFT_1161571 [Mycena haematopus]|nr:hypothetical protein B0H12DRAFT_1161571 [Mycena haematopus]